MIRIPTFVGLAALAAHDLSTDYTADRTLQVAVETEVAVETTHFAMERNGEPVEGRFGGGGGGSEMSRSVVHTDQVLAHEDGVPTRVRRVFEEVSSTMSVEERDGSRDFDSESPLDGETLILTLDEDGDVVAELEQGAPDRLGALKGHSLRLALDALLPPDEVDEGDSWEPSGDDLLRAMLLDVEQALFPTPVREEGGEGGRGRGFRRGGRQGSPLSFFKLAEWDTEAELTDQTTRVAGLECVVIELQFEAEGDLPERTFGRDPERFASLSGASVTAIESTFEVELEGKLFVSLESKRPVKLEIEGEFTLDSNTEFSSGDMTMSIERTQEGTIEHSITVTEEDA